MSWCEFSREPVGTVLSSAADILGGGGCLASFALPCIVPTCMIRVTICDIPGSGGFFWCGYTTPLLFSTWKLGGEAGVHKRLGTLCAALLGWWCVNEGFFYSFHQVICKCSNEGQYFFFSFHSSISSILILGEYFLILLEFCPLSLLSSTSYFFLSAFFFF